MLIAVLAFLFIVFGLIYDFQQKARYAEHVAPVILLSIGLLRILADFSSLPTVQYISRAWGASPAPKVFATYKGFEQFSARVFLSSLDSDGKLMRLEFTQALAKRLHGPYNRRNAYATVLSSGPYLASDPLLHKAYDASLVYAMSTKGKLLEELGLERKLLGSHVWIEVVPKGGKDYSYLTLIKEVALDAEK